MTQTNSTAAPASDERAQKNQPGFIAKMRIGYGKQAVYERIGVAWANDDGSFYVKPYGRQILEGGFTLYPVPGEKAGE